MYNFWMGGLCQWVGCRNVIPGALLRMKRCAESIKSMPPWGLSRWLWDQDLEDGCENVVAARPGLHSEAHLLKENVNLNSFVYNLYHLIGVSFLD